MKSAVRIRILLKNDYFYSSYFKFLKTNLRCFQEAIKLASCFYRTTMIYYNEKIYKNQWWTSGETPGVNAVWVFVKNCVTANSSNMQENTSVKIHPNPVNDWFKVEGKDFMVIGGGGGNQIVTNATEAVIAGGRGNRIIQGGAHASIGGGQENVAYPSPWGTIGGGAPCLFDRGGKGGARGEVFRFDCDDGEGKRQLEDGAGQFHRRGQAEAVG